MTKEKYRSMKNVKSAITIKIVILIIFILSVSIAFASAPNSSTQAVDMNKCVKGIDVSHYQGTIDWNLVKSSGIKFVFIKATDAITYTDPMFAANWSGAKKAGITRGAYHFYEPNDNAVSQANNFINVVEKLDLMDLPPVIDIERSPPSGVNNASFCQNILSWLHKVEKALGHKPIIYTNYYFAQKYLTGNDLQSYTLWIADYQNPPKAPLTPSTWTNQEWKFWQYSQSGKCDGINEKVDLDMFNGSLSDLKAFITYQTILK